MIEITRTEMKPVVVTIKLESKADVLRLISDVNQNKYVPEYVKEALCLAFLGANPSYGDADSYGVGRRLDMLTDAAAALTKAISGR